VEISAAQEMGSGNFIRSVTPTCFTELWRSVCSAGERVFIVAFYCVLNLLLNF
jgi:hypothetical protein